MLERLMTSIRLLTGLLLFDWVSSLSDFDVSDRDGF